MKITYQECKGRLYPVVENEKGTEGKYAYERQIYLKTQKTKLFHDLLTNGQLAKELAQTQRMKNIRQRAEEIERAEQIYR